MYTKFPYGTTAENNQLLLPDGMLSIDIEKKAIRLHDGVTQGGFEAIAQQAFFLPFVGEVPTTDLINGTALASLVGLTAGTAQNTEEPWLKYDVDGKVLYIAKKPYRRAISKPSLVSADIVTGSRTVVINDKTYKVRLLTGSGDASEWNTLLYPICTARPINVSIWANYTNADLGIYNSISNGVGQASHVQEGSGGSNLTRGADGGATDIKRQFTANNTAQAWFGWRPVLELVP